MNLSQVKLLIELNRNQFNLSAASDALHIVQSAGTRQLKLLEEELNLALFERKGKRLTGFTETGLKILQQAEKMLLAQDNIYAIALDFHQPQSAHLKIACTHTQAKYFLPKKLVAFKRSHPKVKVHIEQGTPKQLVDWVKQGQVDLAISTEALDDCEQLTKIDCYSWHHVLVVPNHHHLIDGPLNLAAIADYPILTYMAGMTGQGKILQVFKDEGLTLEVDLYATDSDVIKDYVRLGFGVGIIAEMAIDSKLDKDLTVIDLTPWLSACTTKVGFLSNRYLPSFVHDFIELVTNPS
ncbi:LysR family transcriptional regulator [Hydrogenovibrio sp. SC-1]|uniref:LysR substrate-binding domain-containing protein n=1 Tax=Hydrogenovibrio sp. SC-1 TaxID=2065820 RepID=UPI000C7D8DA6|nr:LysR substrate-binding domain-containing protein [Hydrogenovibrio sp. SC-1]PLA74655.1 LysR family transcriptional regulator [Hydrogenovibrio sp. SC-1]